MEEAKVYFSFKLLGLPFDITSSILVQWAIILLVLIACIYLTRNIELVPKNKKQSVVELLVVTINNLVKENMGEDAIAFVPYIGTVGIFLLLMNLSGLFGIEPPTTDYSIALSMALISFIVVQSYAIKKAGAGHYLSGYLQPYPFMLPLNIIERVMLPVSLSLRLFGNMFAASVLVKLIYQALYSLPGIPLFGGKIPLFMAAIPVPVHIYFDIFDGVIQMVVFTMLTMINIKIVSEH